MLVEHRDEPMRAATIMTPLTGALDIVRSRFDLDTHTEQLSLREQAALRAVAKTEDHPPLAHSTSVTAAFDMPSVEATLDTGDLLVLADDTEDEAGADELLDRIDLESATKVSPPPIPDEARFVPFPPEPTHVELPPGILDAATEIETSGVFLTGSRELPSPVVRPPSTGARFRELADQWLEQLLRREPRAVLVLAAAGVFFGTLIASLAIGLTSEPEPVVTPLPPLPVRVTPALPQATAAVVPIEEQAVDPVDPACLLPEAVTTGRVASQELVRRARGCEGPPQLALLNAALEADEDNPHAVAALARHHVAEGSLESAERAARRAIRLRPRRAEYRLYQSLTGGTVAERALRLLILTAARSGEIRGAHLDEIDGDVWTIPAARTKTGVEHRIPLSGEARAVIAEAAPFARDGFLFPGVRKGVISDMTLTALMKRRGMVERPHGFRSSFRTWCAEATDTPRDVAEACLAHKTAGKVEAAYRRTDFLARRRGVMERWAAHCAKANGVIIELAEHG